ncbi:DUF1761 domain-containing protein [Longispora sp. K20-0274]|uniref:DUF1761 domain-containing protein n=1 Tax=Longispora sp. K20-0274 TaxID=3088255 RepID=UPI00399B05A0
MTFGVLGDLNWWAVLVAIVAYFALGGLWFSNLLFAKPWIRATGAEMAGGVNPGPSYYIGPLITCSVATVATAMLAHATGTDTFAEGLVLGIVVGLGISAAVLFVTGFFDPQKARPMLWVAITAGYHLVGLTLVAVILALWT